MTLQNRIKQELEKMGFTIEGDWEMPHSEPDWELPISKDGKSYRLCAGDFKELELSETSPLFLMDETGDGEDIYLDLA